VLLKLLNKKLNKWGLSQYNSTRNWFMYHSTFPFKGHRLGFLYSYFKISLYNLHVTREWHNGAEFRCFELLIDNLRCQRYRIISAIHNSGSRFCSLKLGLHHTHIVLTPVSSSVYRHKFHRFCKCKRICPML